MKRIQCFGRSLQSSFARSGAAATNPGITTTTGARTTSGHFPVRRLPHRHRSMSSTPATGARSARPESLESSESSVGSGILTMHLPRLSPAMLSAWVVQHLKQPGAPVRAVDLLVDVRTRSLLEQGAEDQIAGLIGGAAAQVALGEAPEGQHTMQLEAHDEGWIGEWVVAPGIEVPVNTIIGYMYDSDREAGAGPIEGLRAAIEVHNQDLMQKWQKDPSFQEEDPPCLDVPGLDIDPWVWQAYAVEAMIKDP